MLVKVKRGWELPEHMATPEDVFLNRRQIAKTLAAGPIIAGAAPRPGILPSTLPAQNRCSQK